MSNGNTAQPDAVQPKELSDDAAKEQVVARAEALVRDAEAAADKPIAKAPTKRRATAKTSTKSPDHASMAMVDTINKLAQTISIMAGTIETMGRGDIAHSARRVSDAAMRSVEAPAPAPAATTSSATAESDAGVVDAPVLEVPKSKSSTAATHLFEVLGAYGKYVAMFVGAGLISGSLVHFPLDPTRYALIGACGSILFTVASVFGDFRKKESSTKQMIVLVVAALALALGIGMVSGGIQHFQDFPSRAAKLIPIGIGLSVAAFILRNGYRLKGEHLSWLGAGLVWVLMIVGVGLNQLAGASASPANHHGEEVPAATNGAEPVPSAPTAPAESAEHH
jgi:hypothetical protein